MDHIDCKSGLLVVRSTVHRKLDGNRARGRFFMPGLHICISPAATEPDFLPRKRLELLFGQNTGQLRLFFSLISGH